ncbi:MAG: peptidoglycan-binding domain-containing protein [Pseudomonadota bacterium]
MRALIAWTSKHFRFAALVVTLLAITGCDELRGLQSPSGLGEGAIPVRQAQAGLTALGYAVGPVDGVLGPRTAAAIERFRSREGLSQVEPSEAAIDRAFSDRLAERLAFEGLEWRRRARAAAARARVAEARPDPPPTLPGERDAALEDLLLRYETDAE